MSERCWNCDAPCHFAFTTTTAPEGVLVMSMAFCGADCLRAWADNHDGEVHELHVDLGGDDG